MHRRGLRITLWVALLLAAIGVAYERTDQVWGSVAEGLAWFLSNKGLAAVYVSLIALMVIGTGRAGQALATLAPASRMALTTYLTQSVVMIFSLSRGPSTSPSPARRSSSRSARRSSSPSRFRSAAGGWSATDRWAGLRVCTCHHRA